MQLFLNRISKPARENDFVLHLTDLLILQQYLRLLKLQPVQLDLTNYTVLYLVKSY